ncbi:Collagen alpha 1 chain [Spironucleus salmonicida]|uniref:Collagen alpha 1 chain n=1 Tax=Spironucleus salmonicida TaxID=348837 RepID=V6LIM5_9EUKA|nr:Collagen alpha 1 chain [Spironucleus salmonicida]|eukprot:EST44158.1 Collagen alpha 1 chain precursor [Spironucleus salmonicida]
MQPRGFNNRQNQPRRDGSEASKAKSNKTVDIQHAYCNKYSSLNLLNQLRLNIIPLPPLESSDRLITEPSQILTKYVNRRKCEIKHQQQKQYADLIFSRYNPDGRFLFVGTNHGSIYLYNTYDFSFHYQYYLTNNKTFNQAQGHTDISFHPDNSNLAYISTNKGVIVTVPNLLHFDSEDKQIEKLEIFNDVKISGISVASCGEIMLCGCENGRVAVVDLKNRFKPKFEGYVLNKTEEIVFYKGVNCVAAHPFSREIFAAGGDNVVIIDGRTREVTQTIIYNQNSEDTINKIYFHHSGSLLFILGNSGTKIFDIRNSSIPVFQTKSTVEASSFCWNPLSQNSFAIGDVNGDINFYDLSNTNQNFNFEAPEIEFYRNSDFIDVKTLILQPISKIQGAHRNSQNIGVKIIDLHAHPLGNSLASAGADKDVRFWTSFGAGCFQFDKFHQGGVDPTMGELQFNQSHRELNNQQGDSELFQHLKEIRELETRVGEDIFSREEVQKSMKQYIATAEERYRELEEAAGGFVRERDLGGVVE